MKILNKFYFLLILVLLVGCIEQFEEFKDDNENLTKDDVSARFFFPEVITDLHSPGAWNYLFGKIMARDPLGVYASFGYKNSWEFPDVVFNSNRSWFADSRTWNIWSNYFRTVNNFIQLVEPGGLLENPLMEAVGKIVKANYFHMYTEQWGEIPYTEVGTAGILEPKFDEQKVIYEGLIDELNTAMDMIGDETVTGIGANDLAEYDILFGGDLQKWKSFANALKLRIALRAKGAPGEDFADAAISSALVNPFPAETVKYEKDLDANWNVAGREGDFFRHAGARKMLTDRFVNTLQNNNDPRLEAYADPIPGGEVVFGTYSEPANKELVDYLLANTLDQVEVPYTSSMEGGDLVVNIDDSKDYYVGMPMRFVDAMKTFLHNELFSMADLLTHGSIELGAEIPYYIMPLAEIYFMQAEAAVLGFGGDANDLYRMGIQASFEQWGVEDNGYLDSPIAILSGSKEEKLQQIGLQSWLAAYFVDLQGWAIARDFNLDYITDPTPDLPNIFSNGIPLGRNFPQRIEYAQAAYDLNGNNLREALSRQGPDNGATVLWFAKGEK